MATIRIQGLAILALDDSILFSSSIFPDSKTPFSNVCFFVAGVGEIFVLDP